ncbi:MAG TPA: hypothetical protein VGI81_29390 [Tepidisphaeraceae bacterium]
MRKWMLALLVGFGVIGATTLFAAEKGEEDEGKEVKIKFTEAPLKVQETITYEAHGAKVDSLDKEEQHGKTVYEADAVIDGTNYEIVVDEKGKLISKKIDNEEDEKKSNKKGEKEEKEEHESK